LFIASLGDILLLPRQTAELRKRDWGAIYWIPWLSSLNTSIWE
jgi:hypothetical protein